nr:reverse transcriptase domain-containing protein [Tanacetum cinerariifolium]
SNTPPDSYSAASHFGGVAPQPGRLATVSPTKGYKDAIVVPAITADNFELKHGLLTLVTNKKFFGNDKEDPHAYVRYFNKVTSTLKFPNVRNTFLELHQLDTFYNSLNSKDQDSLNSAAGVTDGNVYHDNIQEFVSQASAVNYNQGITSYRPSMMLNQIRPPGYPPVPNSQNVQLNKRNNQNRFNQNQNRENNFNQGYVYQPPFFQPPAYQAPAYQAPAPQTQGQNMQYQLTNLTDLHTKFVNSNNASTSSSSTLHRKTISNSRSDLKAINTQSGMSYDGPQIPPPPSFHPKTKTPEIQISKPISEPVNSSVSALKPKLRPSIPYPSRMQDQKLHDKANDQREKFSQIFKDLNFNISFADALILMPKFGPSIKSLLTNKDKLYELASTPLNEHYSMVLLNKLPKKLGDPGKFLIPCDFSEKAQCLALADLGASINLMPLSMWSKLSLPDLTPMCMTLELADRSISRPVRVAEDVYVKVEEILLMCSKEVLGFSDVIASGNPTPYYDLIFSTTSPTLTPFGNSDFLLEEVDAFLALDDDPPSPKVDQSYLDPEGDILLLEAFLNDDPSSPLNKGNYMPEVHKEQKINEAKYDKSSIDEPIEVELKDLAPTSNMHFWKKLSDIKGIDPEFCTHKILMEEDFEPAVQHQRRVNLQIYDVIKQKVIKLLDASLWVSPVHCVPKKGGFTVVENEDNELILTRLVTGWRVCIDYQKLNEATRKDHFPLLFMDQMLERLAGNQYYCFLDGFFGYFQIPIDLKDQEKTTFTCPYGTFAYRRMPFRLCNAPGTFQMCMMVIFHDMIEKTMEVFMNDFLVFTKANLGYYFIAQKSQS